MLRHSGTGAACKGRVTILRYRLLIEVINNCEGANALADDIPWGVARTDRLLVV